jgi:hypothetical protein
VTIFHGGTWLGSPDFALNGALGVKSTGLWVGHDQRVTRDPPGAKPGLGEAQAARMMTRVDMHGSASPARAFRPQERALVHDI